MKRHLKLVTLAALACAGISGCAATPKPASVAPTSACTPGTAGVSAQTPRERAEIAAAVAGLRKSEVLVDITERSAKPQLLNGPAVARLLERHYPPLLRERARSGSVKLLMQIGESGGVSHLSVLENSSEPEFAVAAMKVAAGMRFRPGSHRGCAIPVWTQIPMTFAAPR